MLSRTFTIHNQAGLHARPATLFVQKASTFPCNITLIKGTKKINGKSIMGLMSLGVANGEEVTLEVDGEQELQALEALGEVLTMIHD